VEKLKKKEKKRRKLSLNRGQLLNVRRSWGKLKIAISRIQTAPFQKLFIAFCLRNRFSS
jgi:hypothetical protein